MKLSPRIAWLDYTHYDLCFRCAFTQVFFAVFQPRCVSSLTIFCQQDDDDDDGELNGFGVGSLDLNPPRSRPSRRSPVVWKEYMLPFSLCVVESRGPDWLVTITHTLADSRAGACTWESQEPPGAPTMANFDAGPDFRWQCICEYVCFPVFFLHICCFTVSNSFFFYILHCQCSEKIFKNDTIRKWAKGRSVWRSLVVIFYCAYHCHVLTIPRGVCLHNVARP